MHPVIMESLVADIIDERRAVAARGRRFSIRRPSLLARRAARRAPRPAASPAAPV